MEVSPKDAIFALQLLTPHFADVAIKVHKVNWNSKGFSIDEYFSTLNTVLEVTIEKLVPSIFLRFSICVLQSCRNFALSSSC